MRIAVFGLGYVGTVTAAGLASQGHDVCGVDVDAVKVDHIRSGRSPVVEPGIDRLIATAVEQWQAAGDHGSSRCPRPGRCVLALRRHALIAARRHRSDLPASSPGGHSTRRSLLPRPPASGFHAVVVRSTVPPGTGDDLVRETFAETPLPAGWAVGTAMCPEFLREGSGVADFFRPPFVVLGTSDERVTDLLTEMFSFLDREIRVVGVRSAEALKYACNAFHATKVSFTNEMARIFRVLGVDSREVMQVFSEDTILNISAGLPDARLRIRRLLPAQGPARAARHGPGERRWTSPSCPARCGPMSSSSPTSWIG